MEGILLNKMLKSFCFFQFQFEPDIMLLRNIVNCNKNTTTGTMLLVWRSTQQKCPVKNPF